MKLNLGCGEDIREGYINIDIRENISANVVVQDITNLQFEPNSIDEILASDVYEYVSHLKAKHMLKHWNDLLVKDGVLIIRSPSLDVILKYFVECKNLREIENGICMIFGGQNYPENSHYNICHTKLMIQYLEDCNFYDIKYSFEYQNIILKCKKK